MGVLLQSCSCTKNSWSRLLLGCQRPILQKKKLRSWTRLSWKTSASTRADLGGHAARNRLWFESVACVATMFGMFANSAIFSHTLLPQVAARRAPEAGASSLL